MQHRKKIVTALVALALAAALPGCDSDPTPGPTPSATTATTAPPSRPLPSETPYRTPTPHPRAGEIDAYLQELTTQGAFSGTVLVARNGEVVLSRGYGMAAVESAEPNTPGTAFHLASVSKVFAAMSIMILQERGNLSVDDPVCDYVKECPERWKPVTLHHLLTHTSGLRDPSTEQDWTTYNPSYEEAIETYKALEPATEAGAEYYYSNAGYILLGYVVEQVSGATYEDFVLQNILTPLGMSSTGMVNGTAKPERMATGYTEPGKPTNFVVRPVIYAAGGLFSTVEDMLKWDQALYTGKLVPVATLERMFTPYKADYAYGWAVSDSPFGARIQHDGWIGGFRSLFARYPDRKGTIIVLSNLETANIGEIGSNLAFILFK